MATATVLSELRPDEFLAELDVLLAIYADAMDADPALLPGRKELMHRHVGYPSFQALHVQARSDAGLTTWPVVAFSYGFGGRPGQWWYDAVWSAMRRSRSAADTAAWLADCVEVAEVHVQKDHQRGGIGTSMLMSLTRGRSERTAVLSTPDRDTTARRLYRRLGFTDLLTGYSFPGGSPPYAVMGAVLPLREPGPRAGELPDRAASPRSASPSIW